MGYLSQLLQWHFEDLPDAEEVARNGKACAGKCECAVIERFIL